MKTYIVYSTEGKNVSTVKGTRLIVGDKVATVLNGDVIVAIIPYEGKFAVIELP